MFIDVYDIKIKNFSARGKTSKNAKVRRHDNPENDFLS